MKKYCVLKFVTNYKKSITREYLYIKYNQLKPSKEKKDDIFYLILLVAQSKCSP